MLQYFQTIYYGVKTFNQLNFSSIFTLKKRHRNRIFSRFWTFANRIYFFIWHVPIAEKFKIIKNQSVRVLLNWTFKLLLSNEFDVCSFPWHTLLTKRTIRSTNYWWINCRFWTTKGLCTGWRRLQTEDRCSGKAFSIGMTRKNDLQSVTGDICEMSFSVVTSDEADATNFCELYAPWRLRSVRIEKDVASFPRTVCVVG